MYAISPDGRLATKRVSVDQNTTLSSWSVDGRSGNRKLKEPLATQNLHPILRGFDNLDIFSTEFEGSTIFAGKNVIVKFHCDKRNPEARSGVPPSRSMKAKRGNGIGMRISQGRSCVHARCDGGGFAGLRLSPRIICDRENGVDYAIRPAAENMVAWFDACFVKKI